MRLLWFQESISEELFVNTTLPCPVEASYHKLVGEKRVRAEHEDFYCKYSCEFSNYVPTYVLRYLRNYLITHLLTYILDYLLA